MSAIYNGVYRKPAPGCELCRGLGVVRTESAAGRLSVRCGCTDAPESGADKGAGGSGPENSGRLTADSDAPERGWL